MPSLSRGDLGPVVLSPGRFPAQSALVVAIAGGAAGLALFWIPLDPVRLSLLCAGAVLAGFLFPVLQRDAFLGTQILFLTLPVTIPILGDIESGMSFFNVRFSQVIVLISLLALWIRSLLGGHTFVRSGMRTVLMLYLAASLLSFLNSAFLWDSVRFVVKLLFVDVALYTLIVNSVLRRDQLKRVVLLTWASGIVVAVAGFVQLFAYYVFGVYWFFLPENPSPTAFFTEYGWYGIYLSLTVALGLPFYLSRVHLGHRNLLRVLLILSFVGIALSLNRGAWVSTLVVLAVVLLGLHSHERFRFRWASLGKLSVLVLALLGVIGLMLFEPQYNRLEERFDIAGGSVPERLARLAIEFDYIAQHPWIGNGVGTHGRTVLPELAEYVEYEVPASRGGSSFNIFVATLFDTGVLGLMVLLYFLYSLARRLYSSLRAAHAELDRVFLGALALVLVCVLVNSQFNPVFTADFAWAFVALAVVASNLVRQPQVSMQEGARQNGIPE